MPQHPSSAPRGFTLIELVIVVAIVAIMASMVAPLVIGQAERARIARTRIDVDDLASALARLRDDTGSTDPTCLGGSWWLTSKTCPAACGGAAIPPCSEVSYGDRCWNGPYVSTTYDVQDPWNKAFTFDYNTMTSVVTVTSSGPDAIELDSDDITSAQ